MSFLKAHVPHDWEEPFQIDPRFYRFEVPEIAPLSHFSLPSTQWSPPHRQRGASTTRNHSLDAQKAQALQKALEIQRMEILLCEDPSYVLLYAQMLSERLALNHQTIRDMAHRQEETHHIEAILVSEAFHTRLTGQPPPNHFEGSFLWWRLMETLKRRHIPVPCITEHPISRTGVLHGQALQQALVDLRHGFYHSTVE